MRGCPAADSSGGAAAGCSERAAGAPKMWRVGRLRDSIGVFPLLSVMLDLAAFARLMVRRTGPGRVKEVAREWRNGRRAGFRCQCPKGRGGSNPPSRTHQDPGKSLISRGPFLCPPIDPPTRREYYSLVGAGYGLLVGSGTKTATAMPMEAPRRVSMPRSVMRTNRLIGLASWLMSRIAGVKNIMASP